MSDRICYCGKANLLVFRKLRSTVTARSQIEQFCGSDVAPNHASSSGKRFRMTSCELLSPKSLPIFRLLNLHILCRNWLLAVVWCEFRISIKCQICECVRRCATFGLSGSRWGSRSGSDPAAIRQPVGQPIRQRPGPPVWPDSAFFTTIRTLYSETLLGNECFLMCGVTLQSMDSLWFSQFQGCDSVMRSPMSICDFGCLPGTELMDLTALLAAIL